MKKILSVIAAIVRSVFYKTLDDRFNQIEKDMLFLQTEIKHMTKQIEESDLNFKGVDSKLNNAIYDIGKASTSLDAVKETLHEIREDIRTSKKNN